MIALVILIYRVVPNRTFQLSEVWRGALLAGILMEIMALALLVNLLIVTYVVWRKRLFLERPSQMQSVPRADAA
jgi:uncharacterized BrkB/YihY/UPF0761 family membrane protein